MPMTAISNADADLIIGILVFLSTMTGLAIAAWRANRTNREEHAGNTDRLVNGLDKLDQLLENQSLIRHEVHLIRSDVTDIHGAINELRQSDSDQHSRIVHLERNRDGAA
jgi:hypothetical protein